MFEAIINLGDFATLENTYTMSDLFEEKETGYQECKVKGFVRITITEFAEILGEELKYQIEENKNLTPKWVYEYKFKVEGLLNDFEVIDILKLEDEFVYFRTNV